MNVRGVDVKACKKRV